MLELDGVVIKDYKKKGKEKNKTVYNPVNYEITNEKIEKIIFNNLWSKEVMLLKESILKNTFYEQVYLTNDEVSQISFLTNVSKEVENYPKLIEYVSEIIVDENEKVFENIKFLKSLVSIEFNNVEFEETFKSFGSKVPYLKSIFQNVMDENFIPIEFKTDYEILRNTQFPTNWLACKPKYFYPILTNGFVIPFVDKSFVYNSTGWNIFQQIEFSTCQKHMCYYYRQARQGFKIDFENTLKLVSNYTNKYLVDFKNVGELVSDAFYLNRYEIFEFINNLETPDEKDVCFSIYKLVRLFFTSLDIQYIYENIKPIFQDLELSDIDFNLTKTFDVDLFGNKISENCIVAKMSFNERGKKILLDIDTVKKIGIEEILDNDIDFPIEDGIYYTETPNIVYFLPTENSISKNGILSSTGKILKKFLKRTRILFKPEKYLSESNEEVLVDDEFLVPEGRILSGLPCLCFGHLVTEMSLKDKCNYLKKLLK